MCTKSQDKDNTFLKVQIQAMKFSESNSWWLLRYFGSMPLHVEEGLELRTWGCAITFCNHWQLWQLDYRYAPQIVLPCQALSIHLYSTKPRSPDPFVIINFFILQDSLSCIAPPYLGYARYELVMHSIPPSFPQFPGLALQDLTTQITQVEVYFVVQKPWGIDIAQLAALCNWNYHNGRPISQSN